MAEPVDPIRADIVSHVSLEPDFDAAIREELDALKEIEGRYMAALDQVSRWDGSPQLKERKAYRLQERHRKEREPHVLRLADLHQQMMSVTVFGARRTVH